MDPATTHRRRILVRGWRATLAIDLIVALIVIALRKWLTVDRSINWLVGGFIVALVYSTSVWTLSNLTLPYLGERFFKRGGRSGWVLLLGTLFLVSIAGCLASVFLLIQIGIFPEGHSWKLFYTSMCVAGPISFTIGISKYIHEGVHWRLETASTMLAAKEIEEQRARKLAVEARLSSLESRVHPHFLFNTLNSISSLIQEDPVLAERMVERLSALLRFSLDSNQRRTVPLRQEIKIVIDYLEIEKARFGNRLRYTVDAPPELGMVEVPPLSLQTLVENSVKHAISQRREGGEIRVIARIEGGRLNVEVSDDGPGFTAEAITAGHGLDNLQARLSVLFDENACLNILRRDGRTVVVISTPVTEAFETTPV
jgi:two-component system, LytTR family, sensor histidine kinase AlgZ